MNYTFTQISDTDYQLTIDNEGSFIIFLLSSDLERGLPEHVQMIQDFQDESNVQRFVNLLVANPANAFDLYNGTI